MSGEPQLTELLIDGKQVPAADGRTFTVLDPSRRHGHRPGGAGRRGGRGPGGGRRTRGVHLSRVGRDARRRPGPDPVPDRRGDPRPGRTAGAAGEPGRRQAAAARRRPMSRPPPATSSSTRASPTSSAAPRSPSGPACIDYTVREPIGVSGQIIPFNYPLQNTARGSAPALAAGCTVVLKPSPEAPLTPLEIARIALECGLPPGVLNVVPGDGETGAALAGHPGIDQVTFTGSVPTGIKVAQAAAANVVPSVTELGGKSPVVVFADADFDLALGAVAASAFGNAGQTCSAGTRLLLQRGAEEFLDKLVAHAASLRVGPGLTDPDIGPLVAARQRDRVLGYLELAREEGAEARAGGGAPVRPGPGRRLLRRADRPHRADQRGPVRPRGDLRPRHHRHRVRRRGRGPGHRQRQPVRPRPPTSGPATSTRRCAWPRASGPARSTSTPPASAPASSCPSAATSTAAGAGRRASEALASYTQTKNVCIGFGSRS